MLLLLAACAMNKEANKKGDATEGLVYGENHAFWVSAPDGWILDNESGSRQGLYAVFYPKGTSWKSSNAVMYVNTSARKDKDRLEDFIAGDVEHFKDNGSRSIKITNADPIKTKDNKLAQVKLFSGDQWNNNEVAAYIQENKIFVMIVLTSRTESDFHNSFEAFQALVRSYQFLTEDVQIEK
jgi:hypothetical protein